MMGMPLPGAVAGGDGNELPNKAKPGQGASLLELYAKTGDVKLKGVCEYITEMVCLRELTHCDLLASNCNILSFIVGIRSEISSICTS
jgi:hypothetical protein